MTVEDRLPFRIKSRERVGELPNRDLVTTKEAGRYLGVSATVISVRASRGQLPGAFKDGKHWRISRDALKRWAAPIIDEHCTRVEQFHTVKKVVYFVACGDFVKIGFTTKLGLRVHSMRLHNPMPISVLATLPGGKGLEYRLHQQFKHLSVGREWFRYEADLKEYVEGLRQ